MGREAASVIIRVAAQTAFAACAAQLEREAAQRKTVTHLIPMTAQDFGHFVQAAVAGHAEDCVISRGWTSDVALASSRAEFDRLLPQGLGTPGHHLFTIVEGPGETAVGWIWFAVLERDGARTGFVYDIRILPAYRRGGHATRALNSIERKARELGVSSIGLHTFGHNSVAQSLYRKLGFQVTGVSMVKQLDEPA